MGTVYTSSATFWSVTEKPLSGLDKSDADAPMLIGLQDSARTNLSVTIGHFSGIAMKKEYTKPIVTKHDVLKNVVATAGSSAGS